MQPRYAIQAKGAVLDEKGWKTWEFARFPAVQEALRHFFDLTYVDIIPSWGVNGHPRSLLRFSPRGNPDLIGVQSVLDYLNEGGSPLNMPRLGGKSIVGAERHSEFFLEFDRLKSGELPFERQFIWERKGSTARILGSCSVRPAFHFHVPNRDDKLSEYRAEKRISLVKDLTHVLNVIRPNPTDIPFWFKGKLSSNEDYDFLDFYLRPNSKKPQDYRQLVKEVA